MRAQASLGPESGTTTAGASFEPHEMENAVERARDVARHDGVLNVAAAAPTRCRSGRGRRWLPLGEARRSRCPRHHEQRYRSSRRRDSTRGGVRRGRRRRRRTHRMRRMRRRGPRPYQRVRPPRFRVDGGRQCVQAPAIGLGHAVVGTVARSIHDHAFAAARCIGRSAHRVARLGASVLTREMQIFDARDQLTTGNGRPRSGTPSGHLKKVSISHTLVLSVALAAFNGVRARPAAIAHVLARTWPTQADSNIPRLLLPSDMRECCRISSWPKSGSDAGHRVNHTPRSPSVAQDARDCTPGHSVIDVVHNHLAVRMHMEMRRASRRPSSRSRRTSSRCTTGAGCSRARSTPPRRGWTGRRS